MKSFLWTLLAAAAATGLSAAPAIAGADDWLYEARIGVYDHDSDLVDSGTEDGPDINLELLFDKPGWAQNTPDIVRFFLNPHPRIGASINTSGDTSLFYAGAAWNWQFAGPFFIEGSFGAAAHDGNLDDNEPGRKDMGCRVNFHESGSFGVVLAEHHVFMATIEHTSNASLCDENDGLTNLGVRYGYRF